MYTAPGSKKPVQMHSCTQASTWCFSRKPALTCTHATSASTMQLHAHVRHIHTSARVPNPLPYAHAHTLSAPRPACLLSKTARHMHTRNLRKHSWVNLYLHTHTPWRPFLTYTENNSHVPFQDAITTCKHVCKA